MPQPSPPRQFPQNTAHWHAGQVLYLAVFPRVGLSSRYPNRFRSRSVWSFSSVVRPASTRTAGREVRLHDRAATGWVDADVHTAFPESSQPPTDRRVAYVPARAMHPGLGREPLLVRRERVRYWRWRGTPERRPAGDILGCGDYRIIYQIADGQLIILIVGVGHRREAYRALS